MLGFIVYTYMGPGRRGRFIGAECGCGHDGLCRYCGIESGGGMVDGGNYWPAHVTIFPAFAGKGEGIYTVFYGISKSPSPPIPEYPAHPPTHPPQYPPTALLVWYFCPDRYLPSAIVGSCAYLSYFCLEYWYRVSLCADLS